MAPAAIHRCTQQTLQSCSQLFHRRLIKHVGAVLDVATQSLRLARPTHLLVHAERQIELRDRLRQKLFAILIPGSSSFASGAFCSTSTT